VLGFEGDLAIEAQVIAYKHRSTDADTVRERSVVTGPYPVAPYVTSGCVNMRGMLCPGADDGFWT